MIVKTNGVTRIVILIGKYAIKIPNFTYCHLHFIQGCYCNYSERNYCKIFKGMPEFMGRVVPTIFCSWFGLISIQYRVKELSTKLTKKQIKEFRKYFEDVKSDNFGIYKDRIVCIDYV